MKSPIGDKRPGIDPEICFHDVGDDDNSDRGDDASILIKIDKALLDNKQNL